MRRRFSLRLKFILLITTILFIIIALITILLGNFITKTLRDNVAEQSRAFAALATNQIGNTYVLYQDSGSVRITQEIQRYLDLDPNISNVSVINTKGQILYQYKSTAGDSIDSNLAGSFDPVYQNLNGPTLNRIIYPFIESSGTHRFALVYDVSTQGITKTVRQAQVYIIALSALALFITAILLYIAINHFFLRPVAKVSSESIAISRGKLDLKIKTDRNDEINDLAVSVNTMAESLKADIVKLRQVDQLKSEFMMLASHNLRTPISIIRNYIEMIERTKLAPEMAKLVETINANTQRLNVLTEDMLTISQIEANQKITLDNEPLNFTDFIQTITKEFTILAHQKDISFSARLPQESLYVHAAMHYLRSAIWNILDNALKFTEKAGSITLTLVSADHSAILTVEDTGIGISSEELPQLFTKFHRATDTLKYNYEGVGIGLYVTKLIIDQHSGTIAATSQLGHGSTFIITLPIITNPNNQQPK